MGTHDAYGKQVMRTAAGEAYNDWGQSVCVEYGAGQPARIDGTVGGSIAVEIESRVSKQIRGAVLDLMCHRYPKKLLILLPVHMSDAEIAASQCRHIMGRFLNPGDFRVVVLAGSGNLAALEADARIVRDALRELGHGGPEGGTVDPSGPQGEIEAGARDVTEPDDAKWKPWRLSWLGDALLAAFLAFTLGIAVLMLGSVRTLQATLLTRIVVAALPLAGLAFVLATMMWRKYWRRVGWEVGFWSFIFGPEPEYDDARLAWLWGRRCNYLWVLIMLGVFAVPALEMLAGK
jgi:hypothetical protein